MVHKNGDPGYGVLSRYLSRVDGYNWEMISPGSKTRLGNVAVRENGHQC